jgi:hypothetical protein
MLVAYFDESGMHDSEVITVAGFIGDSSEWFEFNRKWKDAIFPETSFHASRIADKSNFVNLAHLIAGMAFVPVAGSVRRDDWNAYCRGKSIATDDEIPTPYHAALMMAFIIARDWVNAHYPDEYLHFVYATHEQYNPAIRGAHAALKRNQEKGGKIASLTFESPEECMPLQAADLYSYETYQEILLRGDFTEPPPPSWPPLKVFHKMAGLSSFRATPEMLGRLAEEHELITTKNAL